MLNPLATHAGTRRLITAAGTAPSVHNTQPWHFIARHREYIELHADPDRWLKITDPRGRSLHISCGAALFNLRLALRISGHRPLTWSTPATGNDPPTLLATVRPTPAAPASAAEHDLYEAIKARRTNRQPFTDTPVPQAIMDELVAAARMEGRPGLPARPGRRRAAGGGRRGRRIPHRRRPLPCRAGPVDLRAVARRRRAALRPGTAADRRPRARARLRAGDQGAGPLRGPSPAGRPDHPRGRPGRLAARRTSPAAPPAGGHRPRTVRLVPQPAAGPARHAPPHRSPPPRRPPPDDHPPRVRPRRAPRRPVPELLRAA
nr:hypothetical protein GCM10020093_024000 [Planobispora longispora]